MDILEKMEENLVKGEVNRCGHGWEYKKEATDAVKVGDKEVSDEDKTCNLF